MTYPATTVTISLPGATAVTAYAATLSIDRGRVGNGLFGQPDVGTCRVVLNNHTRRFDPLYSAGPYFGSIVPGATITVTAGGQTIFTGRVDDWNFEYDAASKRSTAEAICSDALAVLGRAKFDAWTGTNGDTPGDRLAAVLARTEVGWAGSTSLDTGAFLLGADEIEAGSNVLDYCQLVADTDLGLFYASRANAITFADRLSFIGSASTLTFGTGGIPFTEVTTSYGAETLVNQANIGRVGGTEWLATDTASVATYGQTYALEPAMLDLLMQDDVSSYDLATQIVTVYADPIYRFNSITIPVHRLTTAQHTSVLALDIGSVVTVTWTPNSIGTAITRTCFIDGMSHASSRSAGEHDLVLTLNDTGAVQAGNFFTVGDATYGRIGAGGSTNYPIAF